MLETIWHRLLRRPYRLHTVRSGNRFGQTVILLHGIAASSEDWGKVLPYLEPDYDCITIDLLGFGKSPKPQSINYTMRDHVLAIEGAIAKLRLGHPYVLIGHSLGSLVAARYAMAHSQNIQRLLLLSPPVYPPIDSIGSRSARRLTGLLLKIYKFLHDDPRITPDSFRKLMYIAPLPRGIIRDPETWVPFMRSLRECIEQQTISADISRLTIPVDICYGSLDQVVVGYNVERLGHYQHVTLHQFINTHDLTKKYGKLIARIMSAPPQKYDALPR
ncbi:alpha/beta hydrolase [Candidatus Saccharibacteria bacterium]|nr:alpha/beta hydrolase [Candidatus Saccharibacteria bacterium]